MFQTQIDIPHSAVEIMYESRVMTLGSCFSDNIGRKMANAYFQTDINPFGVLYNPVSILNSIELILQNKRFTTEDLFENNSIWQSFSHSSLFSDISAEGCLNKINDRLLASSLAFQQTNFLLITFGTAWVFEEKESGSVVSNCHKLPANRFVRRRLSVDEIVSGYKALLLKLQALLPNLHIIFTVSPIRHFKDGAHENNLSKSTLLLAIAEIQEQFQQVHYFPAYEIQLDELRDYRFYASDMMHPSDVAVDYIWSRFSETYFSPETIQLMKELEQLNAGLSHRPQHPGSAEFLKFKESTEKKKTELVNKYPFLSNRF